MRRDMSLIRLILLEMENRSEEGEGEPILIDGYSDQIIAYHIMLLAEADLIHAVDMSSKGGRHWAPITLTWQGHEFLNASRNESTWKKALSTVTSKTGGVAFEILMAYLVSLAKQQLGLP